jgi:hypothetical protein
VTQGLGADDLEGEVLELSPAGLRVAGRGVDAGVGRELVEPVGAGEHVDGGVEIRGQVGFEQRGELAVEAGVGFLRRRHREEFSVEDLVAGTIRQDVVINRGKGPCERGGRRHRQGR